MKKNIIVKVGLMISIAINVQAMFTQELTREEDEFMHDTRSFNSKNFVTYIEKNPDLYGDSKIYGIPYSEMIYQMRVAVFPQSKTNAAYDMLKDRLHIFPLGYRKHSPENLRKAIKATIDDCYRYLLDHIANGSAYIPEHLYGYVGSNWEMVPRLEDLADWEMVQSQ